jgi:acyl-CoA reductase-like NAD-dependent aldehyde dehydrogenase
MSDLRASVKPPPPFPPPLTGEGREGVASYFYSRDIGRIRRVAEALEYGIVGINEGIISTGNRPVLVR